MQKLWIRDGKQTLSLSYAFYPLFPSSSSSSSSCFCDWLFLFSFLSITFFLSLFFVIDATFFLLFMDFFLYFFSVSLISSLIHFLMSSLISSFTFLLISSLGWVKTRRIRKEKRRRKKKVQSESPVGNEHSTTMLRVCYVAYWILSARCLCLHDSLCFYLSLSLVPFLGTQVERGRKTVSPRP